METPRRGIRRLVRLLVIYASLIALFVVAMTAVYALPQDRIISNAASAADQLRAEGIRPTLFIRDTAYALDNYTDALMIDTSIVDPPASAFEAAIAAVHGNKKNAEGSFDPIEALSDTVEGHRSLANPYAYYWHGYQAALRPTLLLTDLSGIRYLNILLLAALTALVLVRLRDQAGTRAAVAFALALAVAGYLVVPGSLQYSNMTYLMFAAMLAVMAALRSDRLDTLDLEIFFVVGMLAAFFDLLTTPLLTFGMPLAVALIIRSREDNTSLAGQVRLGVRAAAAWATGYVASWFTKILIARFVIGPQVLRGAAEQFLFRAGLDSRPVDIGQMLRGNALRLVPFLSADSARGAPWSSIGPLDIVVAVVVLAALVLLIRYRRPWTEIGRAAHVLLVVPLPYLWFLVASNHSWIHSYFTYRIQLMAVFAVLFVLISAVDFDRMRRGLLYWKRSRSSAPTP